MTNTTVELQLENERKNKRIIEYSSERTYNFNWFLSFFVFLIVLDCVLGEGTE